MCIVQIHAQYTCMLAYFYVPGFTLYFVTFDLLVLYTVHVLIVIDVDLPARVFLSYLALLYKL